MRKDFAANGISAIFLLICAGLGTFYGFLAYRALNWSPSLYISESKQKDIKNTTKLSVELFTPRGPTELSDIEKGRETFKKYYCGVCHGLNGKGKVKNPNSQTGEEIPSLIYVAEGFTKQELREKIKNGVPKIAKKDPNKPDPPLRMPSFKQIISDNELENLMEYLMSLMPKKTVEEEW